MRNIWKGLFVGASRPPSGSSLTRSATSRPARIRGTRTTSAAPAYGAPELLSRRQAAGGWRGTRCPTARDRGRRPALGVRLGTRRGPAYSEGLGDVLGTEVDQEPVLGVDEGPHDAAVELRLRRVDVFEGLRLGMCEIHQQRGSAHDIDEARHGCPGGSAAEARSAGACAARRQLWRVLAASANQAIRTHELQVVEPDVDRVQVEVLRVEGAVEVVGQRRKTGYAHRRPGNRRPCGNRLVRGPARWAPALIVRDSSGPAPGRQGSIV